MASKNEFTFDIPCPKCGKKIPQSLGRLKGKSKIACPSCGITIDVPADSRRNVDRMNRSLDDLDKTLRKLGAKLKR